jgi:hypothetical protein
MCAFSKRTCDRYRIFPLTNSASRRSPFQEMSQGGEDIPPRPDGGLEAELGQRAEKTQLFELWLAIRLLLQGDTSFLISVLIASSSVDGDVRTSARRALGHQHHRVIGA